MQVPNVQYIPNVRYRYNTNINFKAQTPVKPITQLETFHETAEWVTKPAMIDLIHKLKESKEVLSFEFQFIDLKKLDSYSKIQLINLLKHFKQVHESNKYAVWLFEKYKGKG